MSTRFTEDEVRQIYEIARAENRFSAATDHSCNGTLFSIDRMETRGVKLIATRPGIKYEVKAINVKDFVDSPCIWIEENGQGRWAGLQGGWPVDKKDQEEELAYDAAVIRQDRNRHPDPDIDLPVEFMNLERDRSSYLIPRSGWFTRAERRINLYRSLRESWPESLAAKAAREVAFDYDGKPKFKQLILNYTGRVLGFLTKLLIILLAIFGLINIL